MTSEVMECDREEEKGRRWKVVLQNKSCERESFRERERERIVVKEEEE